MNDIFLTARVTWSVWAKHAQDIAQTIHCPKQYIACTVQKLPKNLRYFCNYPETAQSKQPPNGWKFAQSGHPALIWVTLCQSSLIGLFVDSSHCSAYVCDIFRGEPLGANFPKGMSSTTIRIYRSTRGSTKECQKLIKNFIQIGTKNTSDYLHSLLTVLSSVVSCKWEEGLYK
jgi:hypothetical protein